MEKVKAYCVKCKKTREMKDPKKVTKKVGKRTMTFLRGQCAVCGTNMAKIIPTKK